LGLLVIGKVKIMGTRAELYLHPELIRTRKTAIKYAREFVKGVEGYKPFIKTPCITPQPFDWIERNYNRCVMASNYLIVEFKLKPEELY
jgi:hypothetical protein